ncbi:MAG: protein phosphatase 2C domain-containing protein [archaeon]|nr:protein phosphatase 2C domain-containing protein [archaeon]
MLKTKKGNKNILTANLQIKCNSNQNQKNSLKPLSACSSSLKQNKVSFKVTSPSNSNHPKINFNQDKSKNKGKLTSIRHSKKEELKDTISHLKNFNLFDKVETKETNEISKTTSTGSNSEESTKEGTSSMSYNSVIKEDTQVNNFKLDYIKKKVLSYHQISMTGKYSNEFKINQDAYFIYTNFCNKNDCYYAGICDGHGIQGEEVSTFIKDTLPLNLSHNLSKFSMNNFKDKKAIEDEIISTFTSINQQLFDNSEIDKEWSGSTCSSLIITKEKLFVINLGDSRSILGKVKINKLTGEEIFYPYQLSKDHKPKVQKEAERIIKCGGVIRQMKDEGISVGPLRVYMKNKDFPGLAMTRSFGDYYASMVGCLSQPEIEEYYFEEGDKFIILASDGLYDYISNEDIVKIASKYYKQNDIVECCETLYKEARKKWLIEDGDDIDDITIIVIFLE